MSTYRNNYCACDSEYNCGLKFFKQDKKFNGFIRINGEIRKEFRCRLQPKGKDHFYVLRAKDHLKESVGTADEQKYTVGDMTRFLIWYTTLSCEDRATAYKTDQSSTWVEYWEKMGRPKFQRDVK